MIYWLQLTTIGLCVIAATLNAFATTRQIQIARRHRADLERLIAFAAVMSSEEFGAPSGVRKMAREALPAWATVESRFMAPGPERPQ
jgi:hypothetical protein